MPYVYIADTRTNQVIGKVGPFSKGLRPFAVTDDWLLGLRSGLSATETNGAAKC